MQMMKDRNEWTGQLRVHEREESDGKTSTGGETSHRMPSIGWRILSERFQSSVPAFAI